MPLLMSDQGEHVNGMAPEVWAEVQKSLIDVKAYQLLENGAQWATRYPTRPKWWHFRRWYHLATLALEFIKGCKDWNDANEK